MIILRTVLMKVLETLFVPLAFTLTLNPSPKRGEGLQSGSPFGRRGWGMRADSTISLEVDAVFPTI